MNVYAPNKRTPKHLKQKLTELKGKKDNSTVRVRDLNNW